MQKVRDYLTKRRNHKEKGNTLVLYIMWMPLIMGAFGVAVDGTVGTYTVSTLHSGLDTATQSALSRATNPGTNNNTTFKPELTQQAAQYYTTAFYDANRSNGKNPFIICQKTITQPDKSQGQVYNNIQLITPPSGCAYTQANFSINNVGNTVVLNTTIVEQSHTLFLPIIGIDHLEYDVVSSARVTYARG